MSVAASYNGDVVINGSARISGDITPLRARANLLAQADLQPFVIPWAWWRQHDAFGTVLGAAGNDDLGIVGGTFGTDHPTIQTGDLKNAGSTTRYARAVIPLPWSYVTGQTVTLRFHAGMITTVASTACTLDLVAYKGDGELGLSVDLCTTDAVDINSLTFADFDFSITPTALVAGDDLDVRVAVLVNDTATGTAVIGCIGKATLLCDVR
jgi:hypothetical protein